MKNGKKSRDVKSKVRNSKAVKLQENDQLFREYKQPINPSKRHRDRLNGELDNLAKLLPFTEDVIARLDKLSILRLSVSYLRNKNFFQGKSKGAAQTQPRFVDKDKRFAELFHEAIDGFVLVVTLEGEVFYVSEGIKDFLGYSQSQILHQQLETLIHDDDREELVGYLKGINQAKVIDLKDGEIPKSNCDPDGEQRDFVIRLKSVLNTSSADVYKPFNISGTIRKLHMEPDIENLRYALFAFCSPARTSYSMLEIRMKSTLFCSKNRIDLSFLDLDARGKEFFGYSKKDIFGRSSYVLVHRADLQHLRCKHTEIMSCGKSSVGTFRLMNKSNEWVWVCGYARVLYKNGKPDFLVTTNRIMNHEEGLAMMKLRDEADYKALEQIGLIEPEDHTKALELGFPNRVSSSLTSLNCETEPIALQLSSFVSDEGPHLVESAMNMKSESVDTMKEDFYTTESNQFMETNRMANTFTSFNSTPLEHPPLDRHRSPTGSCLSEQTTSSCARSLTNVNHHNQNKIGYMGNLPATISPVHAHTPGNINTRFDYTPSTSSEGHSPNINFQQLPEAPLFDDLSSMELQSNQRFMGAYRLPQQNKHLCLPQQQQQHEQSKSRPHYTSYDQIGPNVSLTTPEYDLAAILQAQTGASRTQQRQYNLLESNVPTNNWMPPNRQYPQHMYQANMRPPNTEFNNAPQYGWI